MTNDSFNQLFNEYRQQVVETTAAAFNVSSPAQTPTWLQILKRHVQEWKQHYGSESQAIQQVQSKYRHKQLAGSANSTGSLPEVDQEVLDVTKSFQKKREAIWMRQQQELRRLGMSVD